MSKWLVECLCIMNQDGWEPQQHIVILTENPITSEEEAGGSNLQGHSESRRQRDQKMAQIKNQQCSRSNASVTAMNGNKPNCYKDRFLAVVVVMVVMVKVNYQSDRI